MGKLGHPDGVLAVEYAHQRIGGTKDHAVQHSGQHQRCAAAEEQQLSDPGPVAFAIALAHQRLCTLCYAVEDGRCHQRKVRHHAIGRHGHIARQPQQQKIEHGGGNAGAHLAHKAGNAQLAALPQQLHRGHPAHELHAVLLFKEVPAADGNADDGRHGCGQRRTGQPQTHGKHKDVVEHHIEQAAAQGSHHGKGGVAVVAHKGRHDVVAHEKRREHKENAGIRNAQRHDLRVAAHQPQQAARRKNARQQKRHAERAGAEDGVGKIPLTAFIALCPEDGVAGSRAKPDHGTNGKDEVVDGQAEVEQGDAIGARRLRDKIGIGQNVARGAQQTENVLRYIFEELLCQVHPSSLSWHFLRIPAYFSTPQNASQHKNALYRAKKH